MDDQRIKWRKAVDEAFDFALEHHTDFYVTWGVARGLKWGFMFCADLMDLKYLDERYYRLLNNFEEYKKLWNKKTEEVVG